MGELLTEQYEAMIANSKIAFMQSKYDDSLMYAKQAIKMSPNNAEGYLCAGNAYMSFQHSVRHYKDKFIKISQKIYFVYLFFRVSGTNVLKVYLLKDNVYLRMRSKMKYRWIILLGGY